MTQISFFSLNDYKERTSSLYPFALASECKTVAECIAEGGSVVGDSLFITNPLFRVDRTVSNTAIYFACIELFGQSPEDIKEEGNFKTFSIKE